MRRTQFTLACLLSSICLSSSAELKAQQDSTVKKQLQLAATAAKDTAPSFRLLPSEEDQEAGNAVPVLLRMVHEQQSFMSETYPKLHEYAELDVSDPKLQELYFDSFARQIFRAGSMSHADWQYPLRSERPYMILLPDLQSQRQLVGRGMTAWVKQQLAKGELDQALRGVKAQLGCSRHCAAAPVVVCHLVGLAIANHALDNLELAMQSDKCPNLYWSLSALPPTLQDLGPMIRWELWATPARLDEPLPPIGDTQWLQIAESFVELFEESSSERYTLDEGAKLQQNMEHLAQQQLADTLSFTAAEIERMTTQERIMRWIYLQYCRLRTQLEPLSYQTPLQILAAKRKIEAENTALLAATGAKSSPYPIMIPQALLTCRNFERRIKFLQTIEALRHHASQHDGSFPASLAELELPAPNDPFTEKPFQYDSDGQTAHLRQTAIDGYTTSTLDYELKVDMP